MLYSDLKKINWGVVCANYDPRKRRALLVEAVKAFLLDDKDQPLLWGTREMVTTLIQMSVQDDPHSALEASGKLASDLTGMAPYMPEAAKGEPEKFQGKMIRRWTWCYPPNRAAAAPVAAETVEE